MRRLRGGELTETELIEKGLTSRRVEPLTAKPPLRADEIREIVEIIRANENVTPTHSARMTKADSLSLPVWRV
jgi:Cu2+-containing amine oxidase